MHSISFWVYLCYFSKPKSGGGCNDLFAIIGYQKRLFFEWGGRRTLPIGVMETVGSSVGKMTEIELWLEGGATRKAVLVLLLLPGNN